MIETLEFRATVAGIGNQADIHHLLSRKSNSGLLSAFDPVRIDRDPGIGEE